MQSLREHFKIANDLFEQGCREEAEAAYLALLEEYPDSAAVLCRLGTLRLQAKDHPGAKAYYQRAASVDPAFPWSYVGLSDILEFEGQYEEAIVALEKAHLADPGLTFIPTRIETIRRRQLEGVNDELAAAAADGSADFRERLETANDLADAGHLSAADAAYRDLLSEQPSSALLLCKLGTVTLRLGRIDDAYALFDRAAGIDADLPCAHVGFADVCEADGRYSEAIAALEAAQVLDPTLSFVGRRIEQLRLKAHHIPLPRIIVADGTEDVFGRALLLISALHVAAPDLPRTLIRFVQVGRDSVRAAIEAMVWDTGLEVDWEYATPRETAEPAGLHAALGGAAAFVAVAFRQTGHLSALMEEAARLGVPSLIAVQFPEGDACSSVVALERAAHDPCLLATHIIRLVERK